MSGHERETLEPGPAAGHAGLATFPPAIAAEAGLDAAEWGMAAFLLSEVALFGTLLMTYVTYLGADTVGPTPREALKLPLVIGMTVCLLSSSVTIHFADMKSKRGRTSGFCVWWSATIVLGTAFLAGTAFEWHDLIENEHLTLGRNLFGTTYYTLVGFHGLHVTIGVVSMLIVLSIALARGPNGPSHRGVQLVSWYWHFVDAVWIAVFSLVYIIGR